MYKEDIRPFKSSDYEQLANWHNLRGTPVLEIDFIPKFGLIKPGICAGFLYKTDCKLATIGSLISNIQASKKERTETLDLLIEMLYQKAILDGFKMVTISTNIPKIKEKFKTLGFFDGDKSIDIFFRRETCL